MTESGDKKSFKLIPDDVRARNPRVAEEIRQERRMKVATATNPVILPKTGAEKPKTFSAGPGSKKLR